jgi:hypothetical protein
MDGHGNAFCSQFQQSFVTQVAVLRKTIARVYIDIPWFLPVQLGIKTPSIGKLTGISQILRIGKITLS